MLREMLLAVLLGVAAVLVGTGAFVFSQAAGLVVSGILLALLAWLLLGEV